MRRLLLLIAAATLAACASEPVRQPAPAGSMGPAAASPVVAAPASTASPAKAEATAVSDGEFQPPAGYKTKKRGNTTVYCRTDTPIGTRFGSEYCYTRSDLERMEASRVNTKQEIDKARRTCTGGGCGGG